ncbi:MAG: hypothetical protein H6993_19275 [Pseudomonadales bacterium]|nr:hypothetical protein [Pseudomonadales bacterium]
MSIDRQTPSNLILDLLRSARTRQRSARALVAAGELFGHSANTMRVTLSRLMGRGLIESPQRGLYRLTRQTDALNDFVERWRLGEARVRPWTPGTWVFAHPASTDNDTLWALDALGFRDVHAGLFARPDNLALSLAELRELALSIGLEKDTLLLEGSAADMTAVWITHWQPKRLNDEYAHALARLEASAKALPALSPARAQLTCFTLGGEMIHRLAKDPLLPTGFVDTRLRERLWRAMLAYDIQGKAVWASSRDDKLTHMPRPQLSQEMPS